MGKPYGALFSAFFRIGAFTFGGGYAMIPLIQREAGEKRKWIDEKELAEIVAIAESTPGPIAINAATFIGRKVAGIGGAACATLGVVLPSFLLIAALSSALQAFRQERVVAYAFFGIRAGVLALIGKALYTLFRQCPKNALSWALMAGAFLASAALRVSALWIVVCCGAAGVAGALLGKEAEDK